MKNILILLSFIFLVSCNTLKKDSKRLNKIDYRHPELVAQKCDDNFTSVDSVHETIRYVKGDPVITYQKVRINVDSLIKTLPPRIENHTDTLFMDVVCPPYEKRIDTVYVDKFMTSTHSANVYLLERHRDSLELEVTEAQHRRLVNEHKIDNKNRTIIILSSILGLLALWKIFKGYIKRII